MKMVDDINSKLFAGWNPFVEDMPKNKTEVVKSFNEVIDEFVSQTEKDVQLNIKRPDTLRSYHSFIRMIKLYFRQTKRLNLKITSIKRSMIIKYLDWILYDRNNNPRTYNNHLGFWVTFLNYCIDRGYIQNNSALTIKKKPVHKKKRKVLPPDVKEKVKILAVDNPEYYTLCMMTYYCFIRRTELTKLKVKDLHLPYFITIPADVSKNRKENNVTIPKQLNALLQKHIKGANIDDYIFSANNFKPGPKKMHPKKISDTWSKFRKKHQIANEYQFYSLKDTGITDLLRKGIPAIKVRDQARHYDLRITEAYTARNDTFDEVIKDLDFTF